MLKISEKKGRPGMGMAIIAFLLSIGAGFGLAFFEPGFGIIAAISIMGAFLVYQNEKKK